jgi:hypothetical protein
MLMFLWGATAFGALAIALIFLRFWRRTGDRLFAFFAAAFGVLSTNWIALALAQPPDEARHLIYILRVVAFLLLSYGILDKNRSTRRRTDS